MKKCIIAIIALLYSFLGADMLFAAANTWTQKVDFWGTGRSSAVGFSIGSKGYIGTGWNGSRMKDFWEYDPAADTWTQKVDLGGAGRSSAVGFSIGSKGYIGTGYPTSGSLLRDFWEYDPAANTWTQKADVGEMGRCNAVGFSIGGKGYIGTGHGTSSINAGDFWEYNPATNAWTQKADVGETGRDSAVGFSIGSKGYIGTGFSSNSTPNTADRDFWEYDPAANTWTQKADVGETGRDSAVGFSIGSKGYIGMGYANSSGSSGMQDFWEYDSATNTWIQKADVGGTLRSGAVGFSIGSKGYIGTGWGGTYYNAFWEYTPSTSSTALYFSHVVTSTSWQTEIAIINTSSQTVTGTLKGYSDNGQLVETKAVNLSVRGRRQIIVADEFTSHTSIGYMIFEADSSAVQGYTKLYQAGIYRASIPAVKEVNTSDIYIPHIASTDKWWTAISLLNTTSTPKQLTITFNNGQSIPYPLNANEHKAFNIVELFNYQPQPDIQSAVISNASGVIGLELFGNIGGNYHMDGILLTDKTASTIYYPHVASDNVWWTGIVAYNTSPLPSDLTITSYNAQGMHLSTSTLSIAGKEKYIGVVSNLGLPAETAWFKIDATRPLSGFELFGTIDGTQLAAYAGSGVTAAKAGVFAKIEKHGWTGIAFVNAEATTASVTLTAYRDNGSAVATRVLSVGGYAKVVNMAEAIFTQNISGATYIAYSSDKNVVGFQLNGSADGMMLDALPALDGGGGDGGNGATLAPKAKALDATTTSNISSVSSDGATVIFSVNTPQVDSLKPDDIIVSGITATTPRGLLRKVVSSQKTSDGSVQVITSAAALTEAFEELHIKGTSNIVNSTSNILSRDAIDTGSVIITGPGKITAQVPATDFRISGESSVAYKSGNFTFEPEVIFDIDISKSKLETFKLTLKGPATLSLDGQAKLAGSVAVKLEKSLVAIPIPLGAIPTPCPFVVLDIEFDPKVGADIEFEGSITADFGFQSSSTIEVGIEYNPVTHSFQGIGEFKDYSFNPYFNKFVGTSAIKLKPYFRAKFGIYIDTVLGPYFDVRPYGLFKLGIIPPMEEWGLGITANVGGEMKFLSKTYHSINLQLLDVYWPMWTSTNNPPSTPTGFTVTAASSSQINLAWTAPTGTVTGYKVYKNGTHLKTVASTSTSDAGLRPSTNYCYTVSAYNSTGESPETSQQCAMTQAISGDVTGYWAGSTIPQGQTTSNNPNPSYFQVVESGGNISISEPCKNLINSASGTINGTNISIQYGSGEIYTGIVNGNSMSGTYTAGTGSGTWTATKLSAAPTDKQCVVSSAYGGCFYFPNNRQYWVQSSFYDRNAIVLSATLTGTGVVTPVSYVYNKYRQKEWALNSNVYISTQTVPSFPLHYTANINFKDGTSQVVSGNITTWETVTQ
jgi:hypothetical protein